MHFTAPQQQQQHFIGIKLEKNCVTMKKQMNPAIHRYLNPTEEEEKPPDWERKSLKETNRTVYFYVDTAKLNRSMYY